MPWWWWIPVVYAMASFVIGVWFELDQGASWDSHLRRMARMAGYAACWPVLAVITVWFIGAFDDEEPF